MRCKLSCQFVKCTFRTKSFSQSPELLRDLMEGIVTKFLYLFLILLRIGEKGSVYRINIVVLRPEEITLPVLLGQTEQWV